MPLLRTSTDTLSQQPSKRKGFHVTLRPSSGPELGAFAGRTFTTPATDMMKPQVASGRRNATSATGRRGSKGGSHGKGA